MITSSMSMEDFFILSIEGEQKKTSREEVRYFNFVISLSSYPGPAEYRR